MTMHFIATSGAMTNGTLVHDFNSIPQTFQHLQVRLTVRDTAAFVQRSWFLEVNGNSPSGSNSQHYLSGDGSGVGSSNAVNQGRWGGPAVPAASASANVFGAYILDILDYRDTNKTKTFRAIGGFDNNGSGAVEIYSYLYNSTNAISSLRFYTNNGFAGGSRIDLYGITSNPVATGA